MPKRALTQEQKLLANHEVDSSSSCWNWTRTLHKDSGYGLISQTRRYDYAHRVSYRIFVGEIPEGLLVCHRCDNRRCINPAHLFLGTYKDNADDMVRKGRQMRGQKHYAAKLNEEQVKAIRSDPRAYKGIAAQYAVTKGLVCAIKRGRCWASV